MERIGAALHEAARMAQILRANGLMIVNGVVYGPAGHGVTVTFAAHTQVLAELAALRARLAEYEADAAVDRIIAGNAATRTAVASTHDDDEGEFEPEPELIDAGDR